MNIKNNLKNSIELHKKENIHPMDVLNGDKQIFDALCAAKLSSEELDELYDFFSHEISLEFIINKVSKYEPVCEDVIDESIIQIIDEIEDDFVKNELIYLNNSPKKKLRSKMMLQILSEDNYQYSGFIELLHLASLIQDDVIDKASIRRYKKTLNNKYDDKTALLVSDYLLMYLMIKLYRLFDFEEDKLDKKTKKNMYDAHYDMFNKLIASEKSAKNVNNLNDYFEYIKGKTSNLFAIALATSYYFEHKNDFDINIYNQYFEFGVEFGNLFQIIDDYKDYYNDELKTGKTKTDMKNGSPNYFLIVNQDLNDHHKFLEEKFKNLSENVYADTFNEQIELLKRSI